VRGPVHIPLGISRHAVLWAVQAPQSGDYGLWVFKQEEVATKVGFVSDRPSTNVLKSNNFLALFSQKA
jgi:hypothetical protein